MNPLLSFLKNCWPPGKLKKLNANKDCFISIIAHDLRSPISAILSLANLLNEDDLKNDERIKLTATMKNSAENVLNLLDNLLVWSRLQLNSTSPILKKVDLSKETEISISVLLLSCQAKEIELKNIISTQLQVIADTDMLQVVWRNLISNAIKFTPQGGQITIKATPRGNWVEMTVRDTGVGISPEVLKKMFKFENISSNSGTNGEKGHGLGLLICQEMVQKMHGKIWVESKLGEGSCFFFTLPLAK